MQQILLLTRSIEIAHSSKTQVGNMRSCVEQLSKDPRVKAIYGVTGQDTGWAALCEVPNREEANRLAALAEVYGQTNVEIVALMPSEHLLAGLEEAERIAPDAPHAFSGSFHDQA